MILLMLCTTRSGQSQPVSNGDALIYRVSALLLEAWIKGANKDGKIMEYHPPEDLRVQRVVLRLRCSEEEHS